MQIITADRSNPQELFSDHHRKHDYCCFEATNAHAGVSQFSLILIDNNPQAYELLSELFFIKADFIPDRKNRLLSGEFFDSIAGSPLYYWLN
jgi:hypothetical protein